MCTFNWLIRNAVSMFHPRNEREVSQLPSKCLHVPQLANYWGHFFRAWSVRQSLGKRTLASKIQIQNFPKLILICMVKKQILMFGVGSSRWPHLVYDIIVWIRNKCHTFYSYQRKLTPITRDTGTGLRNYLNRQLFQNSHIFHLFS